MGKEIAVDLRVARKRSGLSQDEAATLLGVDRRRLSKLEVGRYEPTVAEIAGLSLIYDREFRQLCRSVLPAVYAQIAKNLSSLPPAPTGLRRLDEREQTLARLQATLQGSSHSVYAE